MTAAPEVLSEMKTLVGELRALRGSEAEARRREELESKLQALWARVDALEARVRVLEQAPPSYFVPSFRAPPADHIPGGAFSFGAPRFEFTNAPPTFGVPVEAAPAAAPFGVPLQGRAAETGNPNDDPRAWCGTR